MVYGLFRIAVPFGYVDKPDGRKLHKKITPRVGGLGMALVFLLLLAVSEWQQFGSIFMPYVALIFVVLAGVLDDLFQWGPTKKFIAQAIFVGLAVLTHQLEIKDLGPLLGQDSLILYSFWPVIFTTVCVVGTINAINMIDGLDGLAGLLVIVYLVFFGWMGALSDNHFVVHASILTGLAVSGFLLFNFPGAPLARKWKTFMGDAGSSLLGFILAWIAISLASAPGPHTPPPMILVWVIALPLMDMSSVMLMRSIKKRNTTLPDNLHIHFTLKSRGLSDQQILLVLGLTSVATGFFALTSIHLGIKESYLFYLFLVTNGLFFLGTRSLRK